MNLHTYLMKKFLTAERSCTTKKPLIEIGSSHLYASFGTFCVQNSQLFEAQWDFKLSEKIENSDFTVFKHFNIFQRLTIPSKIDQKKRKYVSYQLFQKYFVAHERSAVKKSFSSYVWSEVDSCFCEAVYTHQLRV